LQELFFSRSDHDSWPSAVTRLIRSNVLLVVGTGNGSLIVFLLFYGSVSTFFHAQSSTKHLMDGKSFNIM
jgi:hypothetical protein